MSVTDTIGDYLTSVRNAVRAGKSSVTVPASNTKIAMTEILKEEKYINNYSVIEDGVKRQIKISLKYIKGNKPAIKGLDRVSKPSLRRYVGADEIPYIRSGMGSVILSTSKGILSGKEARKQRVGGEIICKMW